MATRIAIAHTNDGRYMVFFDDDSILTTLTDSGDMVDSWLDEIYRIHRRRLKRLVVGLDVEWRPSYSRYDAPPVAVLQMCVGHCCLVFQILHADYLPDALFDFLADDRLTFVGVGIHGDVAKLRAGYGLEVGNAVDLRHLAAHKLGNFGLRRAGLPAPGASVGGDEPYHVRRSPWDSRHLSYDQLKYACADAFASFEVGRRHIGDHIIGYI